MKHRDSPSRANKKISFRHMNIIPRTGHGEANEWSTRGDSGAHHSPRKPTMPVPDTGYVQVRWRRLGPAPAVVAGSHDPWMSGARNQSQGFAMRGPGPEPDELPSCDNIGQVLTTEAT